MNKELICGKKAVKGRPGVLSMEKDDMKAFIRQSGTEEARKALRSIKGEPKRGQLCVIFHMFKAGRDKIRESAGYVQNFKLNSPNRPASPPRVSRVASPPRAARRSVMNNINSNSNNKPAPRTARVASSPRRNVVASNTDIEAMLNNLLAKARAAKNAAKNNVNRNEAANLKKRGLMKRREHMYGPLVTMARPRFAAVSNQNFTNRNRNNNYEDDDFFNVNRNANKAVEFARGGLRNRRNETKRTPVENTSRFGAKRKAYLSQKVRPSRKERLAKLRMKKSNNSSSSNRRPMTKPSFPAMVVPSVGGEATRRVPTRASAPYHLPGTRSRVNKKQLKVADEERWRRLKSNKRWLELNMMNRSTVGNKNKQAEIANKKAEMANKILQEVIRNIKNGKLVLAESPVRARVAPRVSRNAMTSVRNLFGSSSSSSPERKRKLSVKERLRKKLSKRSVKSTVPASMSVKQTQRVVRVNSSQSN